jgi:Gpi18-like mannosyltransferase
MAPDNTLLDGWTRWDAAWYGAIASRGYIGVPGPGEVFDRRDIVFFPLYPILMHAGSLVTGNVFLAGFLISNAAFLVALVWLYDLTKSQYGEDVARRAIVLLTASPLAYVFCAVYTESLFLLAAVGTFYFGHSGRWALAALCAAIGGATRLQGIVLTAGLVVLYLEQREFQWRKVGRSALWLPVGLLGTVGYFGYLWARFGYTPMDYYTFQIRGWGHHTWLANLLGFFQGLSLERLIAGTAGSIYLLYVPMLILALALGFYIVLRLRVAHGVWVLLSTFMSIPSFYALGRYLVVLFPLFVAVAILLRHSRWYLGVVYVSLLLQGLLTTVFVTQHWIA